MAILSIGTAMQLKFYGSGYGMNTTVPRFRHMDSAVSAMMQAEGQDSILAWKLHRGSTR